MIFYYYIEISCTVILIMLAKYCCCFSKTENKSINDPLLIEEIYQEKDEQLAKSEKRVQFQKEQEYYQIIKEARQLENKLNKVKN
uniref:Uncharacterized protein n=1 Tax=viral metagenome TaxID=1070528 RepID=A0A6C0JIK7_9ZZZZ